MDEAAVAAEPRTRRDRLAEGRRRRRTRLAGVLAALGAAAIAVALTWQPAPAPTAARTAGQESDVTGAGAVDLDPDAEPGKPPSTAPGGVGLEPEKTGLPAIPAPGGKVRTGSEDEGCFPDMRSYLDAWHESGVEPEPCFTSQPPSEQRQPDGVQRTYNGERF